MSNRSLMEHWFDLFLPKVDALDSTSDTSIAPHHNDKTDSPDNADDNGTSEASATAIRIELFSPADVGALVTPITPSRAKVEGSQIAPITSSRPKGEGKPLPKSSRITRITPSSNNPPPPKKP